MPAVEEEDVVGRVVGVPEGPASGILILTPLEAALLILALFFAVGAATSPLVAWHAPAPWLIAQMVPLLALFAGSLFLARRQAGLPNRVESPAQGIRRAAGADHDGYQGVGHFAPPLSL